MYSIGYNKRKNTCTKLEILNEIKKADKQQKVQCAICVHDIIDLVYNGELY